MVAVPRVVVGVLVAHIVVMVRGTGSRCIGVAQYDG
jgi:hypothetical protein